MTHLFLAVPGWKLSPLHAQSREHLMMQCLQRGVDLSIMPEFASGIDLARNLTVAKFLAETKDEPRAVLGMIDSDIAFAPASVFAILDAIEQGLEVVGALYPKKVMDYKAVGVAAKAGVPDDELKYHAGQFAGGAAAGSRRSFTSKDGGHRFIDADKLGTGFLFMQRAAIEKFIAHHRSRIEHYSHWEPKGTQHLVFFSELQGARQKARDALIATAERFARGTASNGEVVQAIYKLDACSQEGQPLDAYQTEDFAFTTRAKEAGIGCWMYLDAVLAHQGTWVFEGSIAKTLANREKVT